MTYKNAAIQATEKPVSHVTDQSNIPVALPEVVTATGH